MTNHPEPNTVLERIRSGELRMKPRLFFAAKTVLICGIAVVVLLLSIGLASFVSFGLRLNGHESLLGFGARGLGLFFEVFPWPLALIDLALIVLLGWLLRRFKFAYRRSALALLIVLAIIGAAGGLLFDRETGFHDDRFEEAESGALIAPFDSLYEKIHTEAPEDKGIYRGFVVEVEGTSFMMTHDDHDEDADDGTWRVLPPQEFDMHRIHTGDKVYVAGEREGETIEAYGVSVLED